MCDKLFPFTFLNFLFFVSLCVKSTANIKITVKFNLNNNTMFYFLTPTWAELIKTSGITGDSSSTEVGKLCLCFTRTISMWGEAAFCSEGARLCCSQEETLTIYGQWRHRTWLASWEIPDNSISRNCGGAWWTYSAALRVYNLTIIPRLALLDVWLRTGGSAGSRFRKF